MPSGPLPVHTKSKGSHMQVIGLSKRQAQVMELVCQGYTAQEIGEALCLSARTVHIHKACALKRLEARNQTHAAVLYYQAKMAALREAERLLQNAEDGSKCIPALAQE